MDLTTNALLLLIIGTFLGVGTLVGVGMLLRRWLGLAPVPADPLALIATNTNMISGTLEFYERQIKGLREQMDRVEAERKAQEQRMEAERKMLFERVDHADALNKTLGDKLIAISDKYTTLERFTDRILNTLDGTPGGAAWATELRKSDPRNVPPAGPSPA